MDVTTRTRQAATPLPDIVAHLAVVGLAAVVTGLIVAGVGGRLFMRIAAVIAPDHADGLRTDAGFVVGEITVGTLFFILFVGLAAGLVGAVLYLVVEPWIAWASRWRGIVFGLVLLVVAARPSDALGTDNRDFVILGEPLPLVLMIIGLFLAFGVVLVALVDAAAGRAVTDRLDVVAAGVLVGLGAPVTLLVTGSLLLSSDACGCEVPTVATWLLVPLAALTVVWWFGRLIGRRWRRLDVIGHAVFIAAVVVAGRQTGADIASIV